MHPLTFLLREHSHRSVGGVRSKWKGTPQTNGVCDRVDLEQGRPGGDAGWQSRLQSIKDSRVVRPSGDRARSCRAKSERRVSAFSTILLFSETTVYKEVRDSHPVYGKDIEIKGKINTQLVSIRQNTEEK